ncbi:MAG: acylphosphatase [Planctomycetales bacterium]|nr:acylphosphatase [Planctomycetales bacterium]MCA9168221.1 acylphosphatase [Planctomycetales bacterium]
MAQPPSSLIRKVVFFQGHVQGVGFRYTTQRIAKQFPVTGYVRNLNDGSVELLVEGQAADVDGLIREVQSVMADYIRSTDVHTSHATGEFASFGRG